MPYRLCWLLASGIRISLDSWWWTENLPETCSSIMKINLRNSASRWFYYENISRCRTVLWMSNSDLQVMSYKFFTLFEFPFSVFLIAQINVVTFKFLCYRRQHISVDKIVSSIKEPVCRWNVLTKYLLYSSHWPWTPYLSVTLSLKLQLPLIAINQPLVAKHT
jgi:hypothetical protein